ncbi:MAG: DUF2784 domain-containing protein, partial [Planctomycetota bacterium]
MYQLLADIILVIHALLIAFVLVGFVLVVVGILLKWSWIANFWFRVVHLGCIGFVVAKTWLGQLCPLTVWESDLREAAGGAGYSSSFVEYWLHELIFYDFPSWVFTAA